MGYESMEYWLAMKQTKYKRTLDELSDAFKASNGNMNEVVAQALNIVCKTTHAEAGTFWFYSRHGDGLIHPRASFGGKSIDGVFIKPGQGIAGKVVETGKLELISDCEKDSRWDSDVDKKTGFTTKSMICAPLLHEGQSFGCIQLINKQDESLYDEDDAEIVTALCDEIAEGFEEMNLLGDGRLEKKVVVLYSDIRRFTALSKNLDPIRIAEIINRYLSYVSRVVKEHGGIVDKYIGDSVLSYWIYNADHPDAAYEACRAAIDLIEGAGELQSDIKEMFDKEMKLAAGVDMGPAFIGNIGTSVMSDYTIVGNVVNRALFVENIAEEGKVNITDEVKYELGTRVKAKAVNPLSISHKKYDCKVFTISRLD